MAQKKEKLAIIDSNALMHRAWHIMPPLATKDGTVVNAVYGYTTLLLKIIKDIKPDYLIATFDLKGKTWRHEEYKEYKAQRVAQVDEFYDQFPIVKNVITALGIPIMTKMGYEADDVIGSIAHEVNTKHQDIEVDIITGDLDALQLVNDQTKVITLKKGFSETITYDEAAVIERYGLKPAQLIDLKAIQGDSSDNIKGVKGIGAKGAANLIQKFGTLEKVYAKLDAADLKPRTKELLASQKKEALQSQRLVTIVRDLKLKWKLTDAKFGKFDPEEVYQIFQKLEFVSLLDKIPNRDKASAQPAPISKPGFDYQIVRDSTSLQNFVTLLAKQKLVAFDTETTGIDVIANDILGCSFSWQAKQGYYIDLRDDKFKKEALVMLEPLLANTSIAKVGHNIKYDYKVLSKLGINLGGIIFDTMIAAYLISSGRGLRLEDLAFSYLGYKKLKLDDLVLEKPKKKSEIIVADIPLEQLAWYGTEDADITLRLYHKILPELKAIKGLDILEKIEIPLIPVLAEMELTGISLDTKFLQSMAKQFNKEIKKITSKIYKLAGEEFNIASPKQLKEILFNRLAISTAGLKKTKTGISTAASELEKMYELHPIIPLISEFRELTKLQSTYIVALPKIVSTQTKRVHTNFNQTITATGRLSSTDPNLQNIPIRTELGREIRKAFIAPVGYKLLSADYSQIELRLAAHISHDPKMLAAFKKGEDIHAVTAAEIHKIPLTKVDKTIRRTAKEVNFGVLYGLGSTGLAQRTEMNRTEAKEFIERYFTVYKNIRKYIDDTKAFAHHHEYVQTLFGRRRYLAEINSYMPMLRASAERMAINMPLQGTAADLMKLAMIKIWTGLPKVSQKSKILLQVHDELVLEVPNSDINKVAEYVKTSMESIYKIDIPLVVDVEVGQNWGALKKL